MGGRGSGYRIPLTLTKEMRIALTKLAAQEDSPTDFRQALKAMRVGMIIYGVLNPQDLQAMYRRGLISDDEAQFLLEKGIVKDDFRPVKVERLYQALELKSLNNLYGDILLQWESLKTSAKIRHIKNAMKYPDVPNAVKLLKKYGSVQELEHK